MNLQVQLVDDWHRSWRWASVRASWAFSLLVWVVANWPDEFKGLVAYVPAYWRPLATLAVAVIIGAILWLSRVTKVAPKAPGAPSGGA